MTHRAVSNRMARAVSVAIEPLEDRRLLSASISLQNLDNLPGLGSRMAFNRIENPNPTINEVTHDTETMRITNIGDTALVINSLILSDTTNFQLVNPPANGAAIAPGGFKDVQVKFIAQGPPPNDPINETNDVMSGNNLPPSQTGGTWDATLTINTNDPSNPATPVALAGYWQRDSENEEEPNLQTLVNRLFGYSTVIDNTQQPQYLNNGSTAVPYGEEVLSSYWQAANPSQAVTVRQVFAFHNEVNQNNGQDPTAFIAWFAQNNSGSLNQIFSHAADHSQSLLPPLINTANTPAQGSFSPGNTTFGISVDNESSVDSQNTPDINNFGRSGHSLRFYALRDSNGNLIANTWLLAMDYQNGSFDNSDFQDNGYIITNLRPAGQAPAPTNVAAAVNAGQVALSWTGVTDDNSLQGYNIYRSDSATGNFTKLNASPVNGTSFTDNAPLNGTSYYRVSAVDASSESQQVGVLVNSSSSSGGSTNGPDLTLSPVTGNVKTSVVGNSMSGPFRVIVTNSGNQTARGTVEIDLFLSPTSDSVPSGATALSKNVRIVNLKAGKSVTFQLAGFKYPSDANGQDFVVAQLTDVKGITESNTSNNLSATASAINIAPAFVDLQDLFTGSTLPTITAGKPVTIQVPVINNGNVVARGAATITLSASTNQNGSNATTLVTRKVQVLLAPGRTAKYNVTFKVPTLASGTYFVFTDVELPGDTVSSNNTAHSTATFSV